MRASLPTVVVLPVCATPATRTTPGCPSAPEICRRRSRSGPREMDGFLAKDLARVSGASEVPRGAVCAVARPALVGRDTDIGAQQGVLDGLPGVLVEPLARRAGRAGRGRNPWTPASRCRSRTSREAEDSGLLDGGHRLAEEQVVGHRRVAGRLGRRDDGRMPRGRGRLTPPAAPPARHQPGRETDRDDGDADDQVQPLTHDAYPTSHPRPEVKPRGRAGTTLTAATPSVAGVTARCWPGLLPGRGPSPVSPGRAGLVSMGESTST